MGMLSTALRKYYHKSKYKMLFDEKFSLNELSLRMWEDNGFNAVDPSVLSKVISGKRVFTPEQLRVFVHVLHISREDEEYLFYCLHRDSMEKRGIVLEAPYLSVGDMQTFVDQTYKANFSLYFEGDCRTVFQNQSVVLDFLGAVQRQNPSHAVMYTAHGAELLFLQAWASSCVLSAGDALLRLLAIKKHMSSMREHGDAHLATLSSYVDMLYGYVSAEYAGASPNAYADVVRSGLVVLHDMHDIDKVVLAARKVVIGATRIGEPKIVDEVVSVVMQQLMDAGEVRNIAGLSLMKNSLENSVTMKKSTFVERCIAEIDKYAKADFTSKHTYTVSNMKDRIELSIKRHSSLKGLRDSLRTALIVSEQEGFTKQRDKIVNAVRLHEPSMLSSLGIAH